MVHDDLEKTPEKRFAARILALTDPTIHSDENTVTNHTDPTYDSSSITVPRDIIREDPSIIMSEYTDELIMASLPYTFVAELVTAQRLHNILETGDIDEREAEALKLACTILQRHELTFNTSRSSLDPPESSDNESTEEESPLPAVPRSPRPVPRDTEPRPDPPEEEARPRCRLRPVMERGEDSEDDQDPSKDTGSPQPVLWQQVQLERSQSAPVTQYRPCPLPALERHWTGDGFDLRNYHRRVPPEDPPTSTVSVASPLPARKPDPDDGNGKEEDGDTTGGLRQPMEEIQVAQIDCYSLSVDLTSLPVDENDGNQMHSPRVAQVFRDSLTREDSAALSAYMAPAQLEEERMGEGAASASPSIKDSSERKEDNMAKIERLERREGLPTIVSIQDSNSNTVTIEAAHDEESSAGEDVLRRPGAFQVGGINNGLSEDADEELTAASASAGDASVLSGPVNSQPVVAELVPENEEDVIEQLRDMRRDLQQVMQQQALHVAVEQQDEQEQNEPRGRKKKKWRLLLGRLVCRKTGSDE